MRVTHAVSRFLVTERKHSSKPSPHGYAVFFACLRLTRVRFIDAVKWTVSNSFEPLVSVSRQGDGGTGRFRGTCGVAPFSRERSGCLRGAGSGRFFVEERTFGAAGLSTGFVSG